jgi:hypothetical protein
MDVSNSTGQNTDYRVGSSGGGTTEPSLRGRPLLHRLGPKSHHKNVRPPAGKGPWIIEFFKAGTKSLLAKAEIKDAACLVILVEAGKQCSVVVSMPTTRTPKPRRPTPPQKRAGASAEASL